MLCLKLGLVLSHKQSLKLKALVFELSVHHCVNTKLFRNEGPGPKMQWSRKFAVHITWENTGKVSIVSH